MTQKITQAQCYYCSRGILVNVPGSEHLLLDGEAQQERSARTQLAGGFGVLILKLLTCRGRRGSE